MLRATLTVGFHIAARVAYCRICARGAYSDTTLPSRIGLLELRVVKFGAIIFLMCLVFCVTNYSPEPFPGPRALGSALRAARAQLRERSHDFERL
jgi:hypothetical protein